VGLSEAHKPKIRSFSILDLRPHDVLVKVMFRIRVRVSTNDNFRVRSAIRL